MSCGMIFLQISTSTVSVVRMLLRSEHLYFSGSCLLPSRINKSPFLSHSSIQITTLNALNAKPRFPKNLAGCWDSWQHPRPGASGALRGSKAEPGCQSLSHSPSQEGQDRGQPGEPKPQAPAPAWDIPGHQQVGGGEDPNPGDPGPGSPTHMALSDLEVRWGPNSRGCEPAQLWEQACCKGCESLSSASNPCL